MATRNLALIGVSASARIHPRGRVPDYVEPGGTGGVGGAAGVALSGGGFTRTIVADAVLTLGGVIGSSPGSPSYRYVNPARVVVAGEATDGMSWKTAFTSLPTTLVRGLTYYLGDGSYGSRTFNTTENGTQLITIKKATATDHGEDVSGGWSSTIGDGQATWTRVVFATSHWLWDGVSGGGPGQWTSGFGFHISQTTDHTLEVIPNSGTKTNITCRHFSITGTRNGPAGADAIGIHNIEGSSRKVDGFTCSYFYLHNISRCPFFFAPGVANGAVNLVMEYGYTGVFGDPTNAVHAEICSAWAGAGNITFRFNVFTFTWGTGGLIFDAENLFIYGNVFFKPSGSPAWDYPNGVIGSWGGGEIIGQCKVYNNTFVDVAAPSGSGSIFGGSGVNTGGNEIRNNLFVNCPNVGGGTGLFTTKTHNHFISATSFGTDATTGTAGSNPFTNKTGLDFTLNVATPAGTTLAAPYNVDGMGRTRGAAAGWAGADGVWDRGAYERA